MIADHRSRRTAGSARHRRCAGALLAAACVASSPVAALPDGFSYVDTLSDLQLPTTVQFSRDGRVFIAEKQGIIKVFDDLRDSEPLVFADLRTQVHNWFDRGLLGMALDPDFPDRPYVYVLYAYDGGIGADDAPRWGAVDVGDDGCPDRPESAGGCVIGARLSRLTANGDTAVAETVLIEDWYQQHGTHSIGTVLFGADGYLYAGAGEGATSSVVDFGDAPSTTYPDHDSPLQEGGALRAQDLETEGDVVGLSGAIIRVDPDTGLAAPDNPLIGHTDPNARRIVAYGLRNPFRFTVRPGSSELWIGDVGWEQWEELNRLPDPSTATAPLNFGWPCFEGAAPQGGYEAAELPICTRLYAGQGEHPHTPPYLALDRTMAGSLSTVAFHTGSNWPLQYRNGLFFSDFVKDTIYLIPDADADGVPDGAAHLEVFATGAAGLVELRSGPGGDLFFPSIFTGRLVRIRHGDNIPPAATLTLAAGSQAQGAARTIGFEAVRSYDPDAAGDTPAAQGLQFAWDLDDDGAFDDAGDVASVEHAFTTTGTHRVAVRVTDADGGVDSVSMRVHVDADVAQARIDAPTVDTRWRSGVAVQLAASGSEADGSPLPDDAFQWAITLLHCQTGPEDCHPHPLTGISGRTGSFLAPSHEYPSYLRLVLTATTADGTLQDTIEIMPETAQVRLATDPAGLSLSFGATGAQATPFERTVIIGSAFTVAAPSTQTFDGMGFEFVGWSDGGNRQHTVTATMPGTLALTATYRRPDAVFANGFEADGGE